MVRKKQDAFRKAAGLYPNGAWGGSRLFCRATRRVKTSRWARSVQLRRRSARLDTLLGVIAHIARPAGLQCSPVLRVGSENDKDDRHRGSRRLLLFCCADFQPALARWQVESLLHIEDLRRWSSTTQSRISLRGCYSSNPAWRTPSGAGRGRSRRRAMRGAMSSRAISWAARPLRKPAPQPTKPV